MTGRTRTRQIVVGGVKVGGGSPVSVQSMTTTDTRNVPATVAQIRALTEAGCEIVRVAVPDMESATAISAIKARIGVPLVADVHFDHKLALAALENGADKLRINPGNIGGADKVRLVADAARDRGAPIRVGVNAGSLEKELLRKHGGVTAVALAESALRHVSLLEGFGFRDIAVSVKASSVPLMIESYGLIARETDCPLHVGVTEAGGAYAGSIKSAVGIGAVLAAGVGDTIRVSLTGDPVEEVRCAREILKALGLRRFGVEIVSCPTCGRARIDLAGLAARVERYCAGLDKPVTVAVMGCAVNGPGEAKHADVGVAGGEGFGILFKKGRTVAKVPEEALFDRLVEEIDKF